MGFGPKKILKSIYLSQPKKAKNAVALALAFFFSFLVRGQKSFFCLDFPPLALVQLIVPQSSFFPGSEVERGTCNTRVTVRHRKLCLMRE
jgi:hypothetical protein